jgi:dihydrolipoamide dehydrogenase
MVVGELAQERDVVIIGGGPGGYHAAIRASQLGLSVTLVEKNKIGGVCLNEGCIPSKIFTTSSKMYGELKGVNDFGIELSNYSMNLSKLLAYKETVMNQLRSGVEALCKTNKIEVIYGTGYFLSEEKIGVESGHQYDVYKFKHAIIATGTSLKRNKTLQTTSVLDERSIFTLGDIPEHLIVYGSDYISLEVAVCFHSFGAKVSICFPDADFPLDSSINRELKRLLKKSKIQVYKECELLDITNQERKTTITLNSKNGQISLEGSHCFVSHEKKPNIEGLGIDRLAIKQSSDGGYIETNQYCQTSIPHIYAIGDVTTSPKLAVVAIKQGKVAAEAIGGLTSEYDEVHIPTIIHADPPIATVGLTEEEARKEYSEISVSQFPFHTNGYATVMNQKDGFTKVISDQKTGLILGIHIIGHGSIELISSGIIGMEMVARDEDFAFPYYPHPSLNESLLESIEGLGWKSVHLSPQKQKTNQPV